jgi:hypothetical protein
VNAAKNPDRWSGFFAFLLVSFERKENNTLKLCSNIKIIYEYVFLIDLLWARRAAKVL